MSTVLLRWLSVQFSIELDTRRVYVTGITDDPTGEWVTQQARNLSVVLTERVDPAILHPRRDSKFTASFDQVFRTEGIRVFRTPIGAPRVNAFSAVRRHRPPGKPRQVAGLPTRSARVHL